MQNLHDYRWYEVPFYFLCPLYSIIFPISTFLCWLFCVAVVFFFSFLFLNLPKFSSFPFIKGDTWCFGQSDVIKFFRIVQNIMIMNCLINVIPSFCAVTLFNHAQKAFPFWKCMAFLSCYLNDHSCSRSHCKLLMLHTFEYHIFVECKNILTTGKRQRTWYALWAVSVALSWGCVQNSIYNHTKAQLPPDMSKICQSMSF